MAIKRKTTNTPAVEILPPVKGIKGFDKNLQCRGFQFEIGKTYSVAGKIKACESGFHAYPDDSHPLSVFEFYQPAGNRFCETQQDGDRDAHDTKLASAKITIGVELSIGDLVSRAVKWVFDRSKPEGISATGYAGAASATGTRGAASATGEAGAASATGARGAASATGTHSVALATGYESKAFAGETGAICCVCRAATGAILAIRASKVGENGVKPNTWYSLNTAGEFVESP